MKEYEVEVVSTGATAAALKKHLDNVQEISEVTDFPEILDGRVKTLHPAVHAGILARKDRQDDLATLKNLNIKPYDLVVINLYPFVAKVQQGASLSEVTENIDIGGSTLLRAAAKNYANVTLITNPQDYDSLAQEMHLNNGEVSHEFRASRMAAAFAFSAEYECQIAEYFAEVNNATSGTGVREVLATGYLSGELRYGENPHQQAAVYTTSQPPHGLAGGELLNGKPLSYNNLLDADLAWKVVIQFETPTCVIVKHAQPCGAASHSDEAIAYQRALDGDKESAFGGIIAFNCRLGAAAAELIINQFAEVVIAPQFDEKALKILRTKKNLRLLACEVITESDGSVKNGVVENNIKNVIKNINGGFLKQSIDDAMPTATSLQWVTKNSIDTIEDLFFAWGIVKYCRSNAVVIAKDGASCGIGAGQTSRVFSVRCALMRAKDNGIDVRGAVLASDAFFPFADSLELIAEAGISAVIQPGGSKRDDEVIAAADKHNIAMAFTGIRCFYHG